MVDIASRVMTGEALLEIGYGKGLYRTPPYYAVKVPVFSFEKLSDVNSYLGPEMKSTGEVLGIGKTLEEALFKGLTSAGMMLKSSIQYEDVGILISVDKHDLTEVISLAKKLNDLGFRIYSTKETASAIRGLGIDVYEIQGIKESECAFDLLESGKINYIVYTGALMDSTVDDYIALHRRALQLSIPCLTSLDTANALADIIASRYNQNNTELININNLRTTKRRLEFSKMQATGDDYIFIENFDNSISCPESLCISLCNRYTGIGGYGIALIEKSDCADAKLRIFNRDGSEGQIAGNCIRCAAKYLYDNRIVDKENITFETGSGVKSLKVYTSNNRVTLASVNMGKAILNSKQIPTTLDFDKVINKPVKIGESDYNITCVNVGNPHCVVFVDRVDSIDVKKIGPMFENAEIFPERINTEFIRVVNKNTIKMRVYERGNGETSACGTGACAAVVAACENGFCTKGEDITVKVRGGDLIVNYNDNGIVLTGNAVLVYKGVTEY